MWHRDAYVCNQPACKFACCAKFRMALHLKKHHKLGPEERKQVLQNDMEKCPILLNGDRRKVVANVDKGTQGTNPVQNKIGPKKVILKPPPAKCPIAGGSGGGNKAKKAKKGGGGGGSSGTQGKGATGGDDSDSGDDSDDDGSSEVDE